MKFGQRVYHDKHGKGIVIRIQKPYFWVKYDKYEKPIRHEPKQIGKSIKLRPIGEKSKQVGKRVKLEPTRQEPKQVEKRFKLKPISTKSITYKRKRGADWRKDDDVIYLGKL